MTTVISIEKKKQINNNRTSLEGIETTSKYTNKKKNSKLLNSLVVFLDRNSGH